MNIEQNNKMIKDYIINISLQVNSQYNGLIDEDKISRIIEMFSNSNEDFKTEIIPKIDKLIKEVIDNYLDLEEKTQRKIMLKNIDKNINSDFFMEMLKKGWKKTHSLFFIGNLIGEFYIHHVINKDGYGFEYYMNQIEKLYFEYEERQISPKNFELQRATIISSIIGSKLGIDVKNITLENMLKIKNYFLQEYVTNGYVTHSFPDVYYESIMQNGLISKTESKQDKPLEIQEIHEIFVGKGIVSPMGGYPYYNGLGIYYEHDFTKVFKHAIDSPEWFSWFTSADHITTYNKEIEKSPYILRSETDCRRNVDDLCINAGLNTNETKKVVEFYEKQYSKFKSPKLNVAFIPKKTIGKNNISGTTLQDLDLFSTISYVLNDGPKQYTEHSGNVYFKNINPNKFGVSVIPNASNYIKAEQYYRETKEHLTDPDSNLAILQIVNEHKNRLIPSMVPTVEKTTEMLLDRKK